jgi:tetratricopeptide (TPR) repeat protein
MADVSRIARNPAAARTLIEESLAILRELDDRVQIVPSLLTLGAVAVEQDDLDAASAAYEECLMAARAIGDRSGTGHAINGLGKVATARGAFSAARAFFEQSLPAWREMDHRPGLVETLCLLSLTRRAQGDAAVAYAQFQEMLAISREGNRSHSIAQSLAYLGAAAGDLGRWEEAAAHCAESLWLTRSGVNDRHGLSREWALIGLARVAFIQGKLTRAALLLGAAEAICLGGGSVPLWLRRELDRAAAPVRAQMEAAAFKAAWTEGYARPLDQLIAEALGEAPAAQKAAK